MADRKEEEEEDNGDSSFYQVINYSISMEDTQIPHIDYYTIGDSFDSVISFPFDPNRDSDISSISEYGGAPGFLPEFIAAGGNAGIFRLPISAAINPHRPPALELRPHPPRDTQAGSFLRTIVCTSSQIWAGQESGLRFWKFSEIFEGWSGRGIAKRGDEESAPFYEMDCGSPVLCLVADEASGFVWSGHKDGKIRSWRIVKEEFLGKEDEGGIRGRRTIGDGIGEKGSLFREGLSWLANRSPVLSMIITSYGNW